MQKYKNFINKHAKVIYLCLTVLAVALFFIPTFELMSQGVFSPFQFLIGMGQISETIKTFYELSLSTSQFIESMIILAVITFIPYISLISITITNFVRAILGKRACNKTQLIIFSLCFLFLITYLIYCNVASNWQLNYYLFFGAYIYVILAILTIPCALPTTLCQKIDTFFSNLKTKLAPKPKEQKAQKPKKLSKAQRIAELEKQVAMLQQTNTQQNDENE